MRRCGRYIGVTQHKRSRIYTVLLRDKRPAFFAQFVNWLTRLGKGLTAVLLVITQPINQFIKDTRGAVFATP